jgi:D-glycero-alpha-D-manno-heptose 1-phosphate guanylyltransferase
MPTVDEAIILVGGLGTRLRETVPDVPKPLAPIAGRPFLHWLLDHLDRAGVRRAILAVGYRAEMIRSAVGTRHGNIAIECVVEDEPLGTGGALRRSLAHVRGNSAFAFNGDTLFLVDLQRMAEAAWRSPGSLVVALRHVQDADRYGTCVVEGDRIVSFAAAKPQRGGLINGGVYVLPRTLFDRFALPDKFSFEHDFMERHVDELAPSAVISDGDFIDIGVPASYAAAQTLIPAWLA